MTKAEKTADSTDNADSLPCEMLVIMNESDKSTMGALRDRKPCLWINPGWKPVDECAAGLPLGTKDLVGAEARLQRFAPLLSRLFPELEASAGVIESGLRPVPRFAQQLARQCKEPECGRLLLKEDHALPVAGSIKARGGIHAVLCFAEKLALEKGLLSGPDDSHLKLLEPRARELFGRHEVSVGSTGNLGLSIGIMGSALGFRVTVHMSVEAKAWKKERLRKRGVNVVEHRADYTAACVAARQIAEKDPFIHFIDDENSIELFLGYGVALFRLQRQLAQAGIRVEARHPLFLHLPCGVGGAPGGITFAARLVFGDHVHCFFAEPTEAPCMFLGMLTGKHADVSVYDIGLGLKTEADGLAVSRPSRFVGRMMEPLLSGCYTVTDADMFRFVSMLYGTEGIEVEPSSTAGFAGPHMLASTEAGDTYLESHGLSAFMPEATHILWTTGGLFVPAEQHRAFRERGH